MPIEAVVVGSVLWVALFYGLSRVEPRRARALALRRRRVAGLAESSGRTPV